MRLTFLMMLTAILAALMAAGCGATSSPVEKQEQRAGAENPQKPPEQATQEQEKRKEAPATQQARESEAAKKPEKDKQDKQVGVAAQSETNVTVARVVDGDTIEVSPATDGTSDVRLIGVDTPETFGGEEPCGPEASDFTASRLEGRQVGLEFDEDRYDQYDRLLANVWLPDGSMFNETLVAKGYASVATYPPNDRYERQFIAAEAAAPTLACSAPPTATATTTATATARATVPATATANSGAGGGSSASDRLNNGIDDVNCPDLVGPIPTPMGDENNLDSDDDGTACDP